ncbi:MAG TPA: hypothetical protein VHS06_09370, partial [Chloroflexota bacterium]|nr:hypothetical protein [Chloroflexota bacterium]
SAYYRTSVLMNSNENVYEWSAQSANTACGSYAQFILQGPSTYSIMMVSWDSDHAWLYLWPDSLSPVATRAEITIEPGVFHTYRIEADGPTNTIYVDGTPRLSADLQNAAGLTTQVQFGYSHIFLEVPTYSKWDYIRVTTPEPATLAMFLLAIFYPRRRGAGPR